MGTITNSAGSSGLAARSPRQVHDRPESETVMEEDRKALGYEDVDARRSYFEAAASPLREEPDEK